MSLRMRALKEVKLRGNNVKPGDIFPVKNSDRAALIAVGLAEEINADEAQETAAAAGAKAARPQRQKPRGKAPARKEAKPVSAMTVAELRAHAGALGISLPASLRTKADIVSELGRYRRRDMRAGK